MQFSKYQNAKSLLNLSNQWALKHFDELLKDVTRTGTKIPSSNYEEAGLYPIIDQGKELIAGYSNLEKTIKGEKIIFGDHTRVLKYIDFDNFHIGADGVKVLENKLPQKVATKYIYYYLTSIEIPNTGYNRHFKYLKEIVIPVPSFEIQLKLIELFEHVQKLIEKRQSQIAALDELTQSVFLEMFGDITLNLKGFDKVKMNSILLDSPQNGLYKPADEYMDNGVPIVRIDSFYKGKITKIDTLKRVNCTRKEIETYRLDVNDIVINRVNSIQYLGKCGLVEKLNEDTVFESNMMRIKPDTGKVNSLFLIAVLNSKFIYRQILKNAKHSVNQSSINQMDVKNFDIVFPNLDLQSKFAEKVNQIEKRKKKLEDSLVILLDLYNALLQKAFKGELF